MIFFLVWFFEHLLIALVVKFILFKIQLNVLFFFILIGFWLIIVLPLDSCNTVFTIPLFYRIKFLFRFVTKISCALRMQPRTVGAFLISITFDKELTYYCSFTSAIDSGIFSLHILVNAYGHDLHLTLHHLLVLFFQTKYLFQECLWISNYSGVLLIALLSCEGWEAYFMPREIIS